MSHTPFIVAAYLMSTVVMLWVAFAPIIGKRKLLRQLKARQQRMENTQ